jgi:hypothetical protein
MAASILLYGMMAAILDVESPKCEISSVLL